MTTFAGSCKNLLKLENSLNQGRGGGGAPTNSMIFVILQFFAITAKNWIIFGTFRECTKNHKFAAACNTLLLAITPNCQD